MVGWQHRHVAIDHASRLVYAQLRATLGSLDTTAFLSQAVRFFDARGIRMRRVLTDNGRDLGRVVDVVLHSGTSLDVVGYEVEASEALGTAGRHVFIPLPDTVAVSGENLIVPAAATEFVSEDLAGFGASVGAFRTRLREGAS